MSEIVNWVDRLLELPLETLLRLQRDLARVAADVSFTVARRMTATQARPAGSPTGEEDRCLTIPQVAERTGLSLSYLYELALRGLAVKPESFHLEAWSATKDYTQANRRIRSDGYIEGSGGKFMTKSAEIHYDPRYS